MSARLDNLSLLLYPDPRLRRRCEAVQQFDAHLAALAARMIELMRAHNGVGLAAAQVGVPLRLFVMNLSGEPQDDRVLVNPLIRDRQGSVEAEEGCLSLPEVTVQVRRAARCRITAHDLHGQPFELEGDGLPCRVWQHEVDHLNGILILDHASPSEKLALKRRLRELELGYRGAPRKARSAL